MRYLNLIVVVVAALLLSSCSHTYLTSTWHDVEKPPMAFEKIAVVAMVPSKANRGMLENAIVAELKANGIHGVSTMGIFPRANDPKVFEEADREEIAAVVQEKVAKNNIDAMMIIAFKDKEKEEHYVEGYSSAYPATPYYGGYGSPYAYPMHSYPYYNYSYYNYYSYAYSTVYSPGYYYETTSYYLETSLFDVETGSMLWTGQSKTTDPISVNREVESFAQVILEGLMRDRALETKAASE